MKDIRTKMIKDDYLAPRSFCSCGHLGDGRHSDHMNTPFEYGHGKCKVDGCSCKQFTWKKFTFHYLDWRKRKKGGGDG